MRRPYPLEQMVADGRITLDYFQGLLKTQLQGQAIRLERAEETGAERPGENVGCVPLEHRAGVAMKNENHVGNNHEGQKRQRRIQLPHHGKHRDHPKHDEVDGRQRIHVLQPIPESARERRSIAIHLARSG